MAVSMLYTRAPHTNITCPKNFAASVAFVDRLDRPSWLENCVQVGVWHAYRISHRVLLHVPTLYHTPTPPHMPNPLEHPLRDLPTPYIYAQHTESAGASGAAAPTGTGATTSATTTTGAGNGSTSTGPTLLKRKRSIDTPPAMARSSPSADTGMDTLPTSADIKRSKHESSPSASVPSDTDAVDIDLDLDLDMDIDRDPQGPGLPSGPVAAVDDALPISPVASADGRTPLSHDYGFDVLLPTRDTALQRLAYEYISHLNRAQLTDICSLIRDNLKRDLVASVPTEIALNVLARLCFRDIVACLAVSRTWHSLIENSPQVWKHLLQAEAFVPRGTFPQYTATLAHEHPELPPGDEAYKPDFLRRMHTLHHWYDPQFTPQRTTLRGHMTSVVTCLQFADDYVITGADDKMIRVYNARTKRFLAQLQGHEGGVWALKYDTCGILVSGSTDRSVRVWDIRDGGRCLYVFKGHTSTVRCLDIVEYKGAKYVVTGSRDNTLHVWRLCPSLYKQREVSDNNGSEDPSPIVYDSPDVNPYFVGVLKGHVASVRTVAGHGNIVISGSYDNTLIVWDIAQMKCLYILTGHSDRIYSVIYDHERGRCISASMDSTVRVWDLVDIARNGPQQTVTCAGTTCTRVTDSYKVLSGHSALVGLLKLSDKYLVSAAADGTLKGWDAEDYTLRFSYLHSNMGAITTFHMTDNLLVSGSERQFNVYNLRSGQLVHSRLLHDADQVWSVNFRDNLLVAAVEKGGDSSIEMLDFS